MALVEELPHQLTAHSARSTNDEDVIVHAVTMRFPWHFTNHVYIQLTSRT
jgi:hypothetical protein